MSNHIGIIVDPYEEHEPSGLAYVTAQYAYGIIQRAHNCTITLYTKSPFTLCELPSHVHNVIISKSLIGKNWFFLKKYFFHRSQLPDVLIFNMPLLPLILPKSLRTVVFCHEVLYEPDVSTFLTRMVHGVWRLLAFYTIRHARLVCTATYATAQEIEDTYRISRDKLRVIPHGIRHISDSVFPSKEFAHPYFLFVGRTKYKKNMHGTIEGFLRFKEQTECPHLLCLAGKTKDTPYLMRLLSEARERGLRDSIVRLGYVPEEKLLSIIKGATAFVFCSLAEGFGLPVPEAMSAGIPVITSDIPVLSEVAGGAALLVDPEDPNAIAEAMKSVALDEKLRITLREKGLKRAQAFQWNVAQDAFTTAVLDACTQ